MYTGIDKAKGRRRGAKATASKAVKDLKKQTADLEQQSLSWYRMNRVTTGPTWTENFAKHRWPCIWGKHPTNSIAARDRKESHVLEELGPVMRARGLVQEFTDVTMLVWNEDLAEAGLTLLDLQNLAITACDDLVNAPACPVHCHTIVGDHTVAAANMVAAENESRLDCMEVYMNLVVCNRDQHNSDRALHYGSDNNLTKDIRAVTTVWDVINQIHVRYMDIMKKHCDQTGMFKTPASSRQFKNEVREYRKICLAMYQYPLNTQGSFWIIAKRTGSIWAQIKKIVTGDIRMTSRGSTYTEPKYGHFTNMSDIPDDLLSAWLNKVINEDLSTIEFNKKCLFYKKVRKVQDAMVEHVNSKYQEEFKSYEEFCEAYPFGLDHKWFQEMVNWFGTEGKISAHVKSDIKRKIEQRQLIMSKRVLFVYIYVCICLLFFVD